MVIHDHPALAVLHVGEAVTGGQRLGLAVLYVGERVVAVIDRGVAVHADQLLAVTDLDLRQCTEGTDEIGANAFGTGAHGRRQGSPQHAVLGIQRRNRVGVLLRQDLTPFHPCGSHVLLGTGPCMGHAERAQTDQRHRNRRGVHVSPPLSTREAIQTSATLAVNGEVAHCCPQLARRELSHVRMGLGPRVRNNSWPTTLFPAFLAARRSWCWCGSSCCQSWWA